MTPLPPPPRLIRPTHAKPILKAILYLFMFAIWAATVVLTIILINEGLLRWPGKKIPANLISFHEIKSPSGSYHHIAKYRYTLPGQPERADESRLSWTEFRRLRTPFILAGKDSPDITIPTEKPQTIQVYAYDIGPLTHSRAVEHEWKSLLVLIPTIFVPLGLLLSYLLYLAIVIRSRRYRWLFSHGTAVPGVVIGKAMRRTKYGPIYYVYYEFTPAGSSTPRRATQQVPTSKEHDEAIDNQGVTILYDPEKPKRNALYEYGGFAIEGRDIGT